MSALKEFSKTLLSPNQTEYEKILDAFRMLSLFASVIGTKQDGHRQGHG
jgi:hypothetical protein